MEKKTLKVDVKVQESFRVQQVGGLFDVPYAERLSTEFTFDVPDISGDWKIGMIVGPSGSGKTTVAKDLFGKQLYKGFEWDETKAIVDNFNDCPIKEITSILTTVGLSAPPSWIKPYHVLSNGEKFRCDLAKALKDTEEEIIVFDEFTSVVDRTVAKVASLALHNALKKKGFNKKFVAVSCHYDIMEWLQPDWVLDMATGQVAGRSFRRPEIRLSVKRCDARLWRLFGRHHYLSTHLKPGATCYAAVWDNKPVGFIGVICPHKSGVRAISRIVVLPDYQGIGIGGRFIDAVGEIYKRQGIVVRAKGAHQSIIRHFSNSPKWCCRTTGYGGVFDRKLSKTSTANRYMCGFKYIGERNNGRTT